MDDVFSLDAALAADIERLKRSHPKTRELYREVCALLFFRHGITPTANRLYQLVRRGSMGTPTAVLGEFWTELREKSRVRIEHPDLPADLGAAAGELVATLWTRATASAAAALDALREEVENARADAQLSLAAARDELGRVETALEQRTAALLAAQVEVRELEKAQAEGHAQRQALEAELERSRAAQAARDRELVEVREGFSRDLDKLREAAERAEERLRASEKRALLEIDRERSAASKLQKELDETTRRAEQKESEYRRASDTLQTQLGETRHQAGVLQGRLDAAVAENTRLHSEVSTLRASHAGAPGAGERTRSAVDRRSLRATGPARSMPSKPLTRRRRMV